jgi:hypothetical protein
MVFQLHKMRWEKEEWLVAEDLEQGGYDLV